MKELATNFVLLACATLVTGCATTGAQDTQAAQSTNDPDAQTAYYDGEPDVVFSTEFPVESAEEAIARGDSALKEGDEDLALYMYVRAYDMQKENIYALMRIGAIHEARDSSLMASRAYASVLSVEPNHTPALQALGLIYLQAKRHNEARTLLEQAVESDASLWKAYNGLGIIADLEGEHEKAEAAYDSALRANPGDARLLNNRGYSLYLQGKYTEAERDFRGAARQGLEKAWLNLGLVLARQKHYAEAVQLMKRTAAAEIAYNDVGYIAMRQGDYSVAERYFEKAIRVSPRYFEEARLNLDKVQEYLLAERRQSKVILDNESG